MKPDFAGHDAAARPAVDDGARPGVRGAGQQASGTAAARLPPYAQHDNSAPPPPAATHGLNGRAVARRVRPAPNREAFLMHVLPRPPGRRRAARLRRGLVRHALRFPLPGLQPGLPARRPVLHPLVRPGLHRRPGDWLAPDAPTGAARAGGGNAHPGGRLPHLGHAGRRAGRPPGLRAVLPAGALLRPPAADLRGLGRRHELPWRHHRRRHRHLPIFCHRNAIPILGFADRVAVCAPIGLGLGRIANFINGELWGRPAPLWWPGAMVFPRATPGTPVAARL